MTLPLEVPLAEPVALTPAQTGLPLLPDPKPVPPPVDKPIPAVPINSETELETRDEPAVHLPELVAPAWLACDRMVQVILEDLTVMLNACTPFLPPPHHTRISDPLSLLTTLVPPRILPSPSPPSPLRLFNQASSEATNLSGAPTAIGPPSVRQHVLPFKLDIIGHSDAEHISDQLIAQPITVNRA